MLIVICVEMLGDPQQAIMRYAALGGVGGGGVGQKSPAALRMRVIDDQKRSQHKTPLRKNSVCCINDKWLTQY
jgi:hypothetical protein